MFVIVRHGNTFEKGQMPRRIGSRTDLSLTSEGLAQARALGMHFAARKWTFARVLVSPLLRTRQTASAILKELDSPRPDPQTAAFLREIDHGPDENATQEEIHARIGRAAVDAWDKSAIAPPGWKVEADMRTDAWNNLFDADKTQDRVLLVTSNGAARFALLADAALRQSAQQLANLKLPTGGYGVIARDSNASLAIAEWGARP